MEQLEGAGCKATVRSVREALGSKGSNTTIMRFMTEVNKSRANRLRELDEHEITDEEIEKLSRELSCKAYLSVMAKSRKLTSASAAMAQSLIEQHEQDLRELNEDLDQARSENERLQATIDSLASELKDFKELAAKLKSEKIDLNMQLSTERQRADNAQQRNDFMKEIGSKFDRVLDKLAEFSKAK